MGRGIEQVIRRLLEIPVEEYGQEGYIECKAEDHHQLGQRSFLNVLPGFPVADFPRAILRLFSIKQTT
jgi:hypothetical protein